MWSHRTALSDDMYVPYTLNKYTHSRCGHIRTALSDDMYVPYTLNIYTHSRCGHICTALSNDIHREGAHSKPFI